ncbi:hypothetical protein EOPP23_10435 [Endozoicomonas sp. OPT23]|uniref:YtfJ family protein n=1 Tax=Endozoicomonas sp. OPT23 TaxID=2072845 RepID=UPI00129B61B7|nr:YtfJ family protein [Endozoicomonas sp. OPT23]MRI33402.1 hypothetical protein [Endozoicomonas sp. OPT23]
MANVTVGAPLPAFTLQKEGKNIGKGKYEPFSSSELAGEATIFIAMAGHPAVPPKMEPVNKAVSEKFPEFRVASLINTKESPMGAGIFVKGEFKKAYKKAPTNLYLLDAEAVARDTLGLEKLSAFVAVLNAAGEVVYAFEGQTGDTEVAAILEAIESVK